MTTSTELPPWTTVLVVIAHPDDESFGLGAVIDSFVRGGAQVDVLCLTQGEASTLGGDLADLAAVRQRELSAAADALGIASVRLLDLPDGRLSEIDLDAIVPVIVDMATGCGSQGLLVFDPNGITGHPDHMRATQAAAAAALHLGIDVLAWSLPDDVASTLRSETGAPFAGRAPDGLDIALPVERSRQREAVSCHPSQAVPSSALWRRLELLGDVEYLSWLPSSATR